MVNFKNKIQSIDEKRSFSKLEYFSLKMSPKKHLTPCGQRDHRYLSKIFGLQTYTLSESSLCLIVALVIVPSRKMEAVLSDPQLPKNSLHLTLGQIARCFLRGFVAQADSEKRGSTLKRRKNRSQLQGLGELFASSLHVVALMEKEMKALSAFTFYITVTPSN
jgi:hypothetical protein